MSAVFFMLPHKVIRFVTDPQPDCAEAANWPPMACQLHGAKERGLWSISIVNNA